MLIKYRLRRGSERKFDTWDDAAKEGEVTLAAAQLSGVVEFEHAGNAVLFSSRWVSQLHIDPANHKIHIALSVERPLRDFPSKDAKPWQFSIDYLDGSPHDWSVVGTEISWL